MSATAEKASTCTHTLMDATCFFLYIWIYTILNCVQHRYCFSAVKGFQAQILWSQKDYLPWLLRTCSSVCCTRQKKPSGLTLWKTNGEKIFSPRQPGYRSSGHCPWPIFRTTSCSRHIHIEFDCWHGHFLCKYWRIVLPCNLVCARWPSSSSLPPYPPVQLLQIHLFVENRPKKDKEKPQDNWYLAAQETVCKSYPQALLSNPSHNSSI